MKKLNLGCGDDYKEGFINVDIENDPDVKHDLNSYPWPWLCVRSKEKYAFQFCAYRSFMLPQYYLIL
jgi:hypothetical protein